MKQMAVTIDDMSLKCAYASDALKCAEQLRDSALP